MSLRKILGIGRARSARTRLQQNIFELQPLEQRLLFAFQAGVNFQVEESGTPAGYYRDFGQTYRAHTNGLTYGWNTSNSANAFDRGSTAAPDKRYDTLARMQASGGASTWEIAVPNGTYQVKVVAGDPTVTSGATYKINAEGTLLVNGSPTSSNRWVTGTANVSVSDGKLTLTNASGAVDNRIAFVEITDASRTSSVPAVPTGVRARGASATSVDLIWNDASDNETSFKVYRSTSSGGTYSLIGTTGPGATFFSAGGLPSSATPATYYYKVAASNAAGDSAMSGYDGRKALANNVSQVAYTSSNAPWAVGPAAGTAGMRVEAEDFDAGAQGIAYNDGNGANIGGAYRAGGVDIARYPLVSSEYFVGWTVPGEWVEYTVSIATAGTYRLDALVGYQSTAGTFHVETGGIDLTGAMQVPTTGAATTFSTVTRNVVLSAGTHVLRVVADTEGTAGNGVGNFNAMTLTYLPALATPTSFNGTATSPTQVNLTWTDNASGESGYELQYSESSTFASGVTTVALASNATSRSVTGLTASKTYHFRLRAMNGTAGGVHATTSVTTPALATAPAAPSGLAATAMSATQINVSWTDASSNETGFVIERATNSTFTQGLTSVAATAANVTSHNNTTGLSPSTTYYYRVRAINGAGDSANSNTASATTQPATPGAITTPLSPTDDTYVQDGGNSGNSYPISTELFVKTFGYGGNRNAYLKFDISALSTTNSATLRLYGRNSSSTPENVVVHVHETLNDGWQEETLTWNNQLTEAGYSNTSLANVTVRDNVMRWYEFEVTALVAARKAAGASVVSLALRSPDYTTSVPIFNSSNATSNQPQLVVVSHPPIAPSGLSATAVSPSQINVSWTDASANETGFIVERSTSTVFPVGAETVVVTTTAANVTSYSDTAGLSPSTTYYYRVRAKMSETLASANSAIATGTTLPDGPATTLGAVADAYVQDGTTNEDENFGGSAQLLAKTTGTGGNRNSYLRFDLTTITTVEDAKLRLYGRNSDAAPENVVVHVYQAANETWQEMSIDWLNQPGFTGSSLDNVTVPDNVLRWYEFDVTAVVAAQKAAGATSVSFELRSPFYSTSLPIFNSSDASSNQPRLVVVASSPVTTPPTAPSNLTATAASPTQVNLAWTDNASDEGGFRVERSTDGTAFTPLPGMPLAPNVTTYSDSTVVAGTRYWYRVVGTGAAGAPDSPPSNTVDLTTPNTLNVSIDGPSSIDEGGAYTLSLSVSGQGSDPVDHWSIDWGDGVVETLPASASQATHVYVDGDINATIVATAVTVGAQSAADSLAVDVENVAPTLSAIGPSAINEFETYALTLARSDPGADTMTWTIDWGDGSAVQVLPGDTTSVEHAYGPATTAGVVTITASDEDGTYSVPSVAFDVAPAKPVGLTATALNGTQAQLQWLASTAIGDSIGIEISSDGLSFVPLATATVGAGGYLADNLAPGADVYFRTNAVRAGGAASAWSNTAYVRTPGSVVATGAAAVDEGATYQLALHANASGVSGWTIDWGDGSTESLPGTATSVSHVYADAALGREINVAASAGSTSYEADPVHVDVGEVPPTVAVSGAVTATAGDTYQLGLHASDPGTDTVVEWRVSWGDGSAVQVVTGNPSSVTHVYSAAGQFAISAVAIDEDGSYRVEPLVLDVAPALSSMAIMGPLPMLISSSSTVADGVLRLDGNDWVAVTSPAAADPGTALAEGAHWVLREGASFLVGIERTLTVPSGVDTLALVYEGLTFDGTSQGRINDALEVALLAADGRPLASFAADRDAAYNVTHTVSGHAAGAGVVASDLGNGRTELQLDVAALQGQQVRVQLRLVNADADNDSTVRLVGSEAPQATRPQLDPIAPITVDEGGRATLVATFSDPDAGDSHAAMIDWGDMSGPQPATIDPVTKTITAEHVYADDGNRTTGQGTYHPRVQLTDGVTEPVTELATATVQNVAPRLDASIRFEPIVQKNARQLATVISGTFADPAFNNPSAGTSETFTVTIDWGDGTAPQRVAASVVPGAAGTETVGTFTATHVYANAPSFAGQRFFNATVTAADDDQGAATRSFGFGLVDIRVVPTVNVGSTGVTSVHIYKRPWFEPDEIDVDTLRFGPGGAPEDDGQLESQGNNPFRRADFRTALSGIRLGDTEAFVTGQLNDGTFFVGMDEIKTNGSLPTRAHGALPGSPKFFVVNDGAAASGDNAYRYTAAGGAIGFYAMDATMRQPRGVASNPVGDLLWTIDGAGQVQVTNAGNGAFLGAWRAAQVERASGITTDGTNIWVVDDVQKRVRLYANAAGLRKGIASEASSFALAAANASPTDVVTDGTTIWVTDDATDKVFVYARDGQLLGQWQLDAANANASGITLAAGEDDLWVVDRTTRQVYHYAGATDWRDGARSAAGTFALQTANTTPEGIADPPTMPPMVSSTPGTVHSVPGVGDLWDVTSAFEFGYDRTSLYDADDALFAGLSVERKAGDSTFMRNRLLLVVRDISEPGIVLPNAHGLTADGHPYYDLTAAIGSSSAGQFPATAATQAVLQFLNPGRQRFGYTLQILSGGNTAPRFASDPYAGDQGHAYSVEAAGGSVLEIVAKSDNTLRYPLAGDDREQDPVRFEIVSGPAGMTVEDVDGQPVLTWQPTLAGTHTVRLRVLDQPHGATDRAYDQIFTVRAVTNVQNRPPRFTTTPVVVAYAGEEYRYDADGFDPDGDTLAFSYLPDVDETLRPGGDFAIAPGNGVVTWRPTYADIGKTFTVRLRVSDQQEPALYGEQEYQIEVRRGVIPGVSGTPDLTVTNVSAEGVRFDPQRLRAEGVVTATISNIGLGSVNDPFDVLFFEDLNFDGQYTSSTDNVLGSTRVEQPLMPTEPIAVAAAISGAVQFAGGHIWAFVDSGGVIAETNELNNADRTKRDCRLLETTAPGYTFSIADGYDNEGNFTNVGNHFHAGATIPFGNPPGSAEVGGFEYSESVRGLTEFAIDGLAGEASIDFRVGIMGGLFWQGPLLNHTIQVDAYAGNGAEDITDYEAPSLGVVGTFGTSDLALHDVLSFDLTNILATAVASELDWLGVRLLVLPTVRDHVALTFDQFHLHTAGGEAPDLIPSYLRTSQESGNTSYTVRVGNAGNVQAPTNVRVAFYDGDPNAGGTFLATNATLSTIDAGRYQDVSVTVPNAPSDDLWVVVDDNETVAECNETNNSYSLVLGSAPLALNENPVITSVPAWAVHEGDEYEYQVVATDPNGHALAYELVTKPVGMTIDAVTGKVTWQPRPTDVRAHVVLVRVSDGRGGTAIQRYELDVRTTNLSPEITSRPTGPAALDQPYRYQLSAEDGNGDKLMWALDAASRALDVTISTSGLLSWTPEEVGEFRIAVSVSDGRGGTDVQTFWLSVVNENTPPHIASAPEGPIFVDEEWSYDLLVSDIEDGDNAAGANDKFTFYLDEAATELGMAIDAAGRLTWTPRVGGTFVVTISVQDSGGATASQTLTLPVENRPTVNRSADIYSEPTGPALVGSPWQYLVKARDLDGDAVTMSVTKFLDADGTPITGYTETQVKPGQLLIEWTPTAAVKGPVRVEVSAADVPDGAGEVQSFDLAVLQTRPPNNPPTITSTPPLPGVGGADYVYVVRATDADGDDVTFTLGGADAGGLTIVRIDGQSARVRWASPQPDTQRDFTIRASDGQGGWAEQRLVLRTGSGTGAGTADTPPTITSEPIYAVVAGQPYRQKVTATDADASTTAPISYGLLAPARPGLQASINTATGTIDWQTTTADIGEFDVIVTASQAGATASQRFRVRVTDPAASNAPPTIQPATGTLRAVPGGTFEYRVFAVDPDGHALTFWLMDGDNPVSELDGLRIDNQGRVEWAVPPGAQPRSFTVRAVDPLGATDDQNFDVGIGTDLPPTVSLAASTTSPTAGSEVRFFVQAQDDLGIAARQVTLTAPWLTTPLVIDVGTDGIARYTLPTSSTIAGQSFSIKATVRDTGGNVVTTGALPLAVAFAGTASPAIALYGVGNGVVFDQPTDLAGRVTDTDGDLVYWSLVATPSDGRAPITLASDGTLNGTTPIDSVDGFLATVNTSELANGNYLFQLFAQDASRRERSLSFTAAVKSNTADKVGDFALNFTDLETTVGPVPITIQRTYSSNRADQSGDFGFGWDLTVSRGKLEVDVRAGEDPFFDGYLRAYATGTRVTITLPDGSTRGFTAVALPDTSGDFGAGGFLSFASLYTIAFMPDDDSRDVRLELASGDVKPLNVGPGQGLPLDLGLPPALTENGFVTTTLYVDDNGEFREPLMGGGLPWNPATHGVDFQVETLDGTKYTYDSETGELIGQSDRVGNSVTYANDGDVIESRKNGTLTGKVEIVRLPSSHLVDKITWFHSGAQGTTSDTIEYDYVNGELVTVTDQTGKATHYGYNEKWELVDGQWVKSDGLLGRPHFLTRITDGTNGVDVMRAIFDPATGHLQKFIDADGNSAAVSVSTALPGGLTAEIVRNTAGYATETVRDGRGNVVRQIQQTGTLTYLVTVSAYDGEDNKISETRPFSITESSGTTTLRYTTTPSGTAVHAYRGEYNDDRHPHLPTKEVDAAGVETTYVYNGRGDVISMTEGGELTTNTIDRTTGQLTQSVDPAGNLTIYHYEQGNLVRVEQRTPSGQVRDLVNTGYNLLGQMTSSTDSTGVVTSYGYDARGRLKSTSYVAANGTVVRSETDYDAAGRITGVRKFVNDVEVTEDAASFDAGGRMLTVVDRFGHVTVNRYDARGNVVESRSPEKDAQGNDVVVIVRTAYDADGRVIARTDPYVEGTATTNVRVTHTLYDNAGRAHEVRRIGGVDVALTHVTGGTGSDYLGGLFRTTFQYDRVADTYAGTPAADRVISASSTTYDGRGRVETTVSETGLVTHHEYDDADREKRVWFELDIDGDGDDDLHETTFAYDAQGRQTLVRDAAGRVTETQYDAQGQATHTILRGLTPANVTPGSPADTSTADDIVLEQVYDERGRHLADVDALGRRTDYEYDGDGRLIAVTQPAVDVDGSATGTADRRRPRYEYHYDAQGNRTHIVAHAFLDDATAKVVYVTRDAAGSTTEVSRPSNAAYGTWPKDKGSVTRFTYDGEGRQLTRTLPLGVQTTGDANDFVERSVYVTTLGPGYGQLKYEVDFEGRVTAYDYDNTSTGRGRVSAVRYYNTLAAYTADTNGTAAVRKISSTYDAFGRQTTVNDSAFAPAVNQYVYDVEGRLTTIDSPQGTLHYAYDALGRKVATWTGSESTLAAARTGATTLTEYGYDDLNRLTSTKAVRRFDAPIDVDSGATGNQPERTDTVFAVDGQIDYELTWTKSGGVKVTEDRTYDTQGRVASARHFVDANDNHAYDTGESLVEGLVYTYDKDGSRRSETRTNAVGTTAVMWAYDGLGRVAREALAGLDGSGDPLTYVDRFRYDFSGNRIETAHDDQTAGGTPGSAGADAVVTATYDGNDRLLREVKDSSADAEDRHTTLEYGGPTNPGTDQTKKVVRAGLTSGGTITESTTYGYDVAGRMSSVAVTSGSTATTVTYAYDAGGFRVERTEGGQTTVYHADPANPTGYAQVLEEGVDDDGDRELDANEVDVAYTLAAEVLTQATRSQVLHLVTDPRGTTRAVLDIAVNPATAAAMKERYAYTAYGVDLGLGTNPLTAVRYVGQMIDPTSGLSFNRARWYDPRQGRFTQADPWAGDAQNPSSFNKYVYGHGNPVNATDPTGGFALLELLVTAVGGQGLEKLGQAYRGAKGTVEAAKFLVRLGLVQMQVYSFRLEAMNGKHLFIAAYYFYEWTAFEKRVSGAKGFKLIDDVSSLSKYVAAIPGAAAQMDRHDYADPGKLKIGFLPEAGKGDKDEVVFVPLTGRRSYDFFLSTAASLGPELFSFGELAVSLRAGAVDWDAIKTLAANAVRKAGIDISSSGKIEGRTWHHHEIMGIMELLDEKKHNPKYTKQFHTGGAKFWSMIHDKRYGK
ncbi:MAG TPA: DNRLRE domain-containing protein [Tepidisphaeraceae bacterium]|jgi:RHS repeat-associated protein|nr:DNRLRE domain-containing protein [Tepidisphaeraceae bacterium]